MGSASQSSLLWNQNFLYRAETHPVPYLEPDEIRMMALWYVATHGSIRITFIILVVL
jgi:hypothetical protein